MMSVDLSELRKWGRVIPRKRTSLMDIIIIEEKEFENNEKDKKILIEILSNMSIDFIFPQIQLTAGKFDGLHEFYICPKYEDDEISLVKIKTEKADYIGIENHKDLYLTLNDKKFTIYKYVKGLE